MIQTDVLIIGAGPVGLFTVFEAGLLKLKSHLIDALPYPGGQCSEIYPKKPIFDIPAYPEVLAGDLVNNLLKQIEPFQPNYTLGERAETIEKDEEGFFTVSTQEGTQHRSKVVIIAGGLGSFEPRKPPIPDLSYFENKGVDYFVKDPEKYRNKKVLISGGGDSALDWTIQLSSIAEKVTLIHRRNEFRGALDSVEKVRQLAKSGIITLITNAEVKQLIGTDSLEQIGVRSLEGDQLLTSDYFIPLFGLLPKLGPIANWGLEIEKNAIKVDNALDYSTNVKGIYAVGDVNTYPGKLKLILSGFHETTLALQSAYQIINPGKRHTMKYTTVNGITGFDGSKKEAKKSELLSI
ncbi:MAG: NAD(P)/FAD-dependent oxidoreductase [Flavobacteriales bacterium]|nr:NAD(P)/FAD-dependent oxidoreductase [Flavobacteriales bacterium]